jgi:hypothetical protein
MVNMTQKAMKAVATHQLTGVEFTGLNEARLTLSSLSTGKALEVHGRYEVKATSHGQYGVNGALADIATVDGKHYLAASLGRTTTTLALI